MSRTKKWRNVWTLQKMAYFCNGKIQSNITLEIMMNRTIATVVAQDHRNVTVRMSRSSWKRIQQLEESYIVAMHVVNGLAEIKSLKPLTIDEAEAELDRL